MPLQGRHKSMGKDLQRSIRWIETQPAIAKVILGFTESCRHRYSPGCLRFKNDVDGGIKINGYTGNGVIDIFIKIEPISEREAVKRLLTTKWPTDPRMSN